MDGALASSERPAVVPLHHPLGLDPLFALMQSERKAMLRQQRLEVSWAEGALPDLQHLALEPLGLGPLFALMQSLRKRKGVLRQ